MKILPPVATPTANMVGTGASAEDGFVVLSGRS
jgi:hypothetical protein